MSSPPISPQTSLWKRSAPALLLMLAAPMATEVLPGATRFSSIFVLPIEICVWGGGSLLIREIVRRRQLGWRSMLFLALALAIAEECLIQQTSLAPLVLQLKGQVYARAYGVNYVYLLWALVYEAVFVVFVPVYLVELVFRERRENAWVSRGGVVAVVIFFFLGCFLAWFTWTRIAREKVFHVPLFTPPLIAVLIAVAAIAGLFFAALRSASLAKSNASSPSNPPAPWLVGGAGGVWAVLWYGLVVLGFGAFPEFPPAIAIIGGLLVVVAMLLVVPRWTASPGWEPRHVFGLGFGTLLGAMLVGFIGFMGPPNKDLYFKIITNVIAIGLLVKLGTRISRA